MWTLEDSYRYFSGCRNSHGDPVGVIAGAKLLESPKQFGQQTQGHHNRPERAEKRDKTQTTVNSRVFFLPRNHILH